MYDNIINYGRIAIRHKIIDASFPSAGTYTLDLNAGQYEVWLVGAGGGGTGGSKTMGIFCGRGGVGGVIHAKINVPSATTATINIGSGGNSIISGANASASSGQNTSITGLTGVSIYAGGGTGARQTASSISLTITAGTQGTNSASGNNVLEVIDNNPVQVVSEKQQAGVQPNAGWTEDTNVGCGGGFGTVTASSINQSIPGGTGFARVKKVA